ncbi:unnamed protein product [Laminaria digitata]
MMPVADDNDSVNPLAMSGDGFASTLARSIRLGGQSTALLRAALAWAAQVSLGDDPDGSKPAAAAMYGDFKAAKEGAEEMEAQIVLGDRPVEVTLQRAWEALSLGERFDLGRILLGLAFHRAGMGDGGGEGGEGGSNAAEEVGAGAHGSFHAGGGREGRTHLQPPTSGRSLRFFPYSAQKRFPYLNGSSHAGVAKME